jgi:hypothetical protein
MDCTTKEPKTMIPSVTRIGAIRPLSLFLRTEPLFVLLLSRDPVPLVAAIFMVVLNAVGEVDTLEAVTVWGRIRRLMKWSCSSAAVFAVMIVANMLGVSEGLRNMRVPSHSQITIGLLLLVLLWGGVAAWRMTGVAVDWVVDVAIGKRPA